MKFRFFAISCCVLAMMGCATEAQLKDTQIDEWKKTLPVEGADYGAYPTNYEQIIKSNLAKVLKDPESARYSNFSKPRKEHAITNVDVKEVTYGYSSCVLVNSKNSYGGYAGNHLFWFFIRSGEIVRSQDTEDAYIGKIIYRGHLVNCQDGE